MTRQIISSGAPWEAIVGYSRAVRSGNIIHVAGTTAVDPNGNVIGVNNPYEQTRHILSIIVKALEEAGGSLKDVTRTRLFVTDISKWEEVGRAHGEFFKDIRPASTMVQISGLIHPDMMVEIEVDAVLT